MSANDALVQPSEQTKVEFGDAQFSNEDGVKVSPNAATTLFLDSERLEHYRNEKKYRLIRWILFAAFWLIWVALIGSAIAIIVFSPKKKDPSPDTTNTYEVFIPSLNDNSNGFKRLTEQIDPLVSLGISTLLVSPIFKYDVGAGDNTDIKDYVLSDALGSKEDLRALIKTAHNSKVHVIADVPLKLSSKRDDRNLDKFVRRTREGDVLNLGNAEARKYLLNGIAENFIDINGVSFDGIYLHEPSDADVNVDNYNSFLAEAREYSKDDKRIFPSNFVFIIAADSAKGEQINADVIYDRLTATSAKDVITKLRNHASKVISGNITFTPVLSSADVPRFAKSFSDNENLLKLVNGIRLFAFPHSHILYGEEYGQVCDGVPSLCRYPKIEGVVMAHGANIPSFGDELKESAKKILSLHPTLVRNSSIVLDNSITRDSLDGHHYSFVFNDGNTTKSINYKDVIPPQFIEHLKNVGIDGAESDYSEKTEEFEPYEFKILKFLKID